MVVYESDLKQKAIIAMENCMGYLMVGKVNLAWKYYGESVAYDEMLLDEGIDLEEENAHYKGMKDTFAERTKR